MVTEGQVAVASAPADVVDLSPSAVAAKTTRSPFAEITVDAGNRVNVSAVEPVAGPVVPVSEKEMTDKLGWRIPRIEFSESPLSEVAARLNRYNRAQLVIDDASVGDLRISGVVRADRLDSLLEMLKADFAIAVDVTDQREFRLRRKP
jgi:transmembrane sensor